jgi:hypothetical protein
MRPDLLEFPEGSIFVIGASRLPVHCEHDAEGDELPKCALLVSQADQHLVKREF